MSKMNESAAEQLDPARAAELVRVLDLQAQWENMRDDRTPGGANSTLHLQGLQRAFEAFRAGMAGYTARDRTAQVPDLSPSGPDRLAAWCRVVRAVLRRAEHETAHTCPIHVVAKAHRMADRIAARVMAEQAGRELPPTDMAGAIRQLDSLIAWCGRLDGPLPPRPAEGGQAYEVGGRTA